MNDNDIIKALECCKNTVAEDMCNDCPLSEQEDKTCITILCDKTLDLVNRLKSQNKEFDEKIVIQMGAIDWQAKEINRQKAEIERLTINMNAFGRGMQIEAEKVKTAKSEAIKEFADEFEKRCIAGGIYPAFVKRQLDDVKKEMTENDFKE